MNKTGEQRPNMWEELNRPRTTSTPAPPPPPPASSAPTPSEPEPTAEIVETGDQASAAADAMKRIDSQYLLLVGAGLFVLIVFASLQVFGGSSEPTSTAAPGTTIITTPDLLSAVDETTTVPVVEETTTTTAAEPTAMGLPAALLDGPQSAVYRLYRTALGREPDRAGFQYWSDEVRAGTPLERLALEFLASEEFAGQFGADWTPQQRAELLLINAFGEPADDAEMQSWLERYQGLRGADLLLAISEADETLEITGTLR